MRQLPDAFLAKMQALLGEEFAAFRHELEYGERQYAIRANTLKISPSALAEKLGLAEFVPWSDAGIYATREARLGAHPLHHAGAFYVQEPSAQAVGMALQASKQPLRVLDLCAAPGGKSTHLAARMGNQGMLVCNEIHPTRARALAENLERLGCIGAVTNETPERLAQAWGAYFDVVLVDAPCSGEGMFRKHDAAIEAWSPAHIEACAVRQSSILESAAQLVRAGGQLIYSTCTFSKEENEDVVEKFLEHHAEFAVLRQPITPLDTDKDAVGLGKRLFPHLQRGEGHFLATLQKIDGETHTPKLLEPPALGKLLREFEFEIPRGLALEFRGNIEVAHVELPSLEKLKAIRAGIPIATLQKTAHKNRLEPHHALCRVVAQNTIELEPSEVAAYLRGETIQRSGESGWVQLAVDGFVLGWGKRVGSTIKNHYPKHLRGNALLED